MAAKDAAVEVAKGRARECKVTLAYAPNLDEAIEVGVEVGGARRAMGFEEKRFRQSAIAELAGGARMGQWESTDCNCGIFSPQTALLLGGNCYHEILSPRGSPRLAGPGRKAAGFFEGSSGTRAFR